METDRQFRDRTEAGEQLAEALRERDRCRYRARHSSGRPSARTGSRRRARRPARHRRREENRRPGNPEFAIGAVASDGSVWQNETAFRGTGGDEEYFEQQREEEAANARQKAERYRDDQAEPDLTDETVVVVDDGVATGSTVRACLKKLQEVTPIVSSSQYRSVRRTPSTNSRRRPTRSSASRRRGTSGGVGQFYANFGQVSDEEAMAYLER